MCPEKVDGGGLAQSFPQPVYVGRSDTFILPQRARLSRQFLIICIARRIEYAAQVHIAHSTGKPGLEYERLSAAFGYFLLQFLEQGAGVVAGRERVNGIFERRGTDRLQAPPHLDPQIGGLRRKLRNQEQPSATIGVCHSCIFGTYGVVRVVSPEA